MRLKNSFHYFYCWLLVVLFPQTLFGQGGNFFVQNFSPESYQLPEVGTSPQNWGVIQDGQGIIYIANTERVLTYDGTSWGSVNGTEGKLCFKFALGSEGRIYTGGKGDLGFFTHENTEGIGFHSLLEELPEDLRGFSRINSVVADEEGRVYFQSKQHLFRWDQKDFHVWKSETGFNKAFEVHGEVLVIEAEVGIWRFHKGEKELLIKDERLGGIQIRGILDAPNKQGISSKEKPRDNIEDQESNKRGNSFQSWVFVTKDRGLFHLEETGLEPLPSDLDGIGVWNVSPLRNGNFAVATQRKGLWVVDGKGKRIRSFDQTNGLNENLAVYPFQDREGGIWCAMGSGLVRVEYPSSFSFLKKEEGYAGRANAIATYQEKLYVGSMLGLYSFDPFSPEAVLELVPGQEKEIWGLLPFGDGLLIASPNMPLQWMRQDKIEQISDYAGHGICRSTTDSNRVFLGLLDGGVASIYYDEGTWRDEGMISGIGHLIYHLQEDKQGNLWVGQTEVSRIDLSNGFHPDVPVTTFDSSQGFDPNHEEYYPFLLEGDLHFGTAKGIFFYDEGADQLTLTPEFAPFFPEQNEFAYCPQVDAKGNVWVMHDDIAGVFRRTAEGKWDWDASPFSRYPTADVWTIFVDPDGPVWIGTTAGLYAFDPELARQPTPYKTLIRSIAIGDSTYFQGYSKHPFEQEGSSTSLSIDPGQSQLAIAWAAPFFDAPGTLSYSYKLEGTDADWSLWSTRNEKEYMNLSPGEYTFQVKARNVYREESEVASFSFLVASPWYQSTGAYLLWGLLALLMFWGLIRLNGARIRQKAEKKRLADLTYQRSLLEASVDAQEKERKRIAGDLHDDIQATLAAVRLKLKMLSKRSGEDHLLGESLEMVTDSIQSVRRISRDLMPASLERLGLGSALKELCKKVNGSGGLKVSFAEDGETIELPTEANLAVYRVVQELFANALKHAGATEIQVGLTWESKALKLLFSDNGQGFDPSVIQQGEGGLGLKNIESRLSLVGGSASFDSAPEKGTQVFLILPHSNGINNF